MSATVVFHVQHLLGVGHQRRAAALARALAREGIDVHVLSGGFPVPGLALAPATLHQLPAARARDRRFRALEDEEGRVVDAAWMARRRDRLLGLVRELGPQLVVTETFPFGRGLLRFELEPLVDWAHRAGHARLVASVRDIVEPRADPARRRQMVATAAERYHAVLVHGDPELLAFAATLPESRAIADRLHYTGYVLSEPVPPPRARTGPVLVSCGGGRVGAELLRASLEARALSRLARHPWQLRPGHDAPRATLEALRAGKRPGVQIEHEPGGFVHALAGAPVSISQAGYNTVAELLATRTPAVLVPYAEEREQGIRAGALAARGLAAVVAPSALTADSLARAVDAASCAERAEVTVSLDGVSRSVELLVRALGGR